MGRELAGGVDVFASGFLWMHDDGAGSGDLSCRSVRAQGCWGHRANLPGDYVPYGPFGGATVAVRRVPYGGDAAEVMEFNLAPLAKGVVHTWADAVAAGARPGHRAGGAAAGRWAGGMCGRFAVLEPVPDLALRFAFAPDAKMPELPAVNVAPTQGVLSVRAAEDGPRIGRTLRWGLVPHWAKDPTIGARMINARSETAAVKPAFRAAFAARRCLVPASGFYEWRRLSAPRQPFFFRLNGGAAFAFAALWARWEPPGGPALETVAILTIEANGVVLPVHDRMPVILRPDDEAAWLAPDAAPEPLAALMRPYEEADMEAYPVTRRMNSPAYTELDAVLPLAGTA